MIETLCARPQGHKDQGNRGRGSWSLDSVGKASGQTSKILDEPCPTRLGGESQQRDATQRFKGKDPAERRAFQAGGPDSNRFGGEKSSRGCVKGQSHSLPRGPPET